MQLVFSLAAKPMAADRLLVASAPTPAHSGSVLPLLLLLLPSHPIVPAIEPLATVGLLETNACLSTLEPVSVFPMFSLFAEEKLLPTLGAAFRVAAAPGASKAPGLWDPLDL